MLSYLVTVPQSCEAARVVSSAKYIEPVLPTILCALYFVCDTRYRT